MHPVRRLLGIVGLGLMGFSLLLAWKYADLPQGREKKTYLELPNSISIIPVENTEFVPGPVDKVKIGYYTYKIKWVTKYMDDCIPGQLDDGCTDNEHSVIRITIHVDLKHQQSALLHEMLHAIVDTSSARASSEGVAELSPLLLEVMHDNPEVMKFLMEKE